MNDMSSIPALAPAVAWPSPVINHPRDALEVASGHSERLIALLGAVVSGINDDILPDCLSSSSMVTAYLQLCIVQEKLEELDKLIAAIVEAMPGQQSSVTKHVEIARRQDWLEAVEAYRQAEAAPGTSDADIELASAAFRLLIATPAPNLGAVQEKMTLIDQQSSWSLTGAVPALLADIERLARAEAAAGMEG